MDKTQKPETFSPSGPGYHLDLKLTISVPEAGSVLGLGRKASYDAARRGEIPVLKFGRRLRVPRAALERLLNNAR